MLPVAIHIIRSEARGHHKGTENILEIIKAGWKDGKDSVKGVEQTGWVLMSAKR